MQLLTLRAHLPFQNFRAFKIMLTLLCFCSINKKIRPGIQHMCLQHNLLNIIPLLRTTQFSSVQLLSCVQLLVTPWTAVCQASLSFTISQSLLKFMSIELVMPSNHLVVYWPFSSCLQSFPASGSLPMHQFFVSGGQSIGVSASASVLPMNIQD